MKHPLFLLLFIFSVNFSFSQNAILKGKISDSKSKETLVGVNIIIDKISGVISDNDGNYKIEIKQGEHKVIFQYIGYKKQTIKINLTAGEERIINIDLEAEVTELEQIVVSAGRYEQKLSDIIVSMQVIKPAIIENTNTTNIESIISMMPGVDVIDGQANIRNGSGWSYGAGSRVLVLVDDLPLLSADANDVKWNFLPVENISQIEIIKGASSSLFGSSALNGIINIRTAFPGNEPKTNINIYNGVYLNPEREELIWWGNNQPLFAGGSFSHLRKIGNLELVTGGNVFSDAGYRKDNNEERMKFYLNLKSRNKKIKDLSYGINTNFMYVNASDFFLWENADSGAWIQNPDGITKNIGNRLSLDPYIVYYNKKGSKHSIKTRYFRTENTYKVNKDKNNISDLFFAEYNFHKRFKNNLDLTIGTSGAYAESDAQLYGKHFSSNAAFFSQLDKKFQKLSLSFGLRWETFRLDESTAESKPVIRTGLNYHLAKKTFLRVSYGQGYRYPSIAEKYTATNLGSINIFPNPELKSESGWSTEAGIKQGIEISNWDGYIDVAAFMTEYKNMMEFVFDFYDTITYKPTTSYYTFDNMGFQSQNIGNTQITGIDVTLTGKGKLFGIPASILLGYTYTDPIDLNTDSTYKAKKSSDNDILKYRYYHSAKGDFELNYKKISTGISFLYHSFMINVDQIFVDPTLGQLILPGYADYREKNNKGHLIFDFRISYQLNKNAKIAIIGKNIFNKEYIGRPGDIRAPRNIALRLSIKI